MAIANQIDIDISTESSKQHTSRALLLLSNSSDGNRSGITSYHDITVHEILYIVLTTILVPVIIITNVLVVTAVGKYKKLQTPTNFFIVSLAFADISIAIVLPFFTAVEIVSENITDTIACISPNRILMMASGVSILMLSLIAYDRHLALAYPLRDIHLSRTDSRFEDPHCSTVEVELHCGKDYLNQAMTVSDECTGASPVCTCKNQRLPNTVTGYTDEQFKHSSTCPLHCKSQDPAKGNRKKDSRSSSKIVSFLEFLSMDDDFPVDCNLPTIGGRTSVVSGMPDRIGTPQQNLSSCSKSEMHKNVQGKDSQTSNISNVSDLSQKRTMSFVDVISFDNDSGKFNIKSDNKRTLNCEQKYSDNSQYGSPVGRTFTIHQSDDTKVPISKTNSYPGLQCSFSATPYRKNAFVPELENNVLSLMGFYSCDESSSVEDFINFPRINKSRGSTVSVNLDLHHNQGLILDAQTLNAQFATNSNGHQELSLQIGPKNRNFSDSKLKATRSYSAYVPPYSLQCKNVPRLTRQFSLDHSTGIC